MSNNPVNKTDIVESVAERAELSKASAARAVNAFMDSIIEALKAGKEVALVGFGSLKVKFRSPRIGRNPKTGAPIQIAGANVPTFKPGKALKDAVNSGAVVDEAVEA